MLRICWIWSVQIYESYTKSYIYTFWYDVDTVLYQFLETGTSDRCLICLNQLLSFSGFSLYPLWFFLYSPFNINKSTFGIVLDGIILIPASTYSNLTQHNVRSLNSVLYGWELLEDCSIQSYLILIEIQGLGSIILRDSSCVNSRFNVYHSSRFELCQLKVHCLSFFEIRLVLTQGLLFIVNSRFRINHSSRLEFCEFKIKLIKGTCA